MARIAVAVSFELAVPDRDVFDLPKLEQHAEAFVTELEALVPVRGVRDVRGWELLGVRVTTSRPAPAALLPPRGRGDASPWDALVACSRAECAFVGGYTGPLPIAGGCPRCGAGRLVAFTRDPLLEAPSPAADPDQPA